MNSLIPTDWKQVKLGEIAKLTSSKRVYLSDYVEEGVPFYRGKEISKLKEKIKINDLLYISQEAYEVFKSKYGIPVKNDILITAVGTLGNIYRIPNNEPFYFKDGNLIWLRQINSSSIFLEYLLSFDTRKLTNVAIGSSQKALTIVALNKVKLTLPPLPEQHRIVSVLETWDKSLEKLTQKIQLKKNIKKGLMQELLTEKRRLKGFGGELGIHKFTDCLKVLSKPKGIKSTEYQKSGFPIFDQSDNKYISGYTNDSGYVYEFSKTKSVILFGDHSRTLKYIEQSAAFGNDGIKLFQGKDGFDTRFIYYRLLIQKIPNTGYNRHFKYLKDETFILPSKEEQTAIAQILTTADNEITALGKKKQILEDQKKYLLNNLIIGQIRTPENLTITN